MGVRSAVAFFLVLGLSLRCLRYDSGVFLPRRSACKSVSQYHLSVCIMWRSRGCSMRVQELFDLNGKVAIVTGGSIGLGRQMAEGLAEAGADLVLCARKKERCEQAAQELEALGGDVLALGCDVKKPADVQAVIDATVERFGRLDILINNAGTSWGAPVEEMTMDQWNKVIETNLTGTFLFSQAAGKVMTPQKRGKIINI